jgi:uncharacterized damage-inducible protein DinB
MNGCDACGFRYDSVPEGEIAERLRHYGREANRWMSLGSESEEEWKLALTARPRPDVWSALEYAGHLVDVVAVQCDRLDEALVVEKPDWASAGITDRIDNDRYNERAAAQVRTGLASAVDRLASAFEGLDAAALTRTGIYNWPVRAERTLAWLGRHTIHEMRHHLGDIASSLAEAERYGPNFVAGEDVSLLGWLEQHRATLLAKCSGATDGALRTRPVSTSTLSLLGLVRHMATVEQFWFEEVFLGLDIVDLYVSEAQPDGDFDNASTADVAEAFATWRSQCAVSRRITSDAESYDAVAAGLRRGEPVNLRWIMVHMIEEYARHNGHADLLRELVDGVTGE